MVATILKTVTSKGIEAATYSVSSSAPSPTTTAGLSSSPADAKNDTKLAAPVSFISETSSTPSATSTTPQNDYVQNNVNHSSSLDPSGYFNFGKVSGYVTDVFSSGKNIVCSASDEASKQITGHYSSLSSNFTSLLSSSSTPSKPTEKNVELERSKKIEDPSQKSNDTYAASASASRKWFMIDPYKRVTGSSHTLPTHHRSSVNAVRNLLEFVDVDNSSDESVSLWDGKSMSIERALSKGSDTRSVDSGEAFMQSEEESEGSFDQELLRLTKISSFSGLNSMSLSMGPGGDLKPKKNRRHVSKAVTASRLGEGTIRAMRDLALNEALELHHALRFWTARLERPLLYYLEFGPRLWASQDDDHHATIGRKVSQLQAVLARRCSSIGELQQHLWRAGWQSGVENWGALGQGEWAAVVGSHGAIGDENHHLKNDQRMAKERKRSFFDSIRGRGQGDSKGSRKSNKNDYYAESHLFVKNVRGGEIVSNDPALAAWAIDAIRVVRDQLYSAGNGVNPLPFYENWPREQRHFNNGDNQEDTSNARLGDSMISQASHDAFEDDACEGVLDIPLWATCDVGYDNSNSSSLHVGKESTGDFSCILPNSEILIGEGKQAAHPKKDIETQDAVGDVVISDLSLMAAEVTEILNSMEMYMMLQRKRRLDKLKPPSRIVRNWYVAAIGIPIAGYVAYNLTKGNLGARLASEVYQKIVSFCAEHVSEPLQSIYRELFTRKGREDVTDRKARENVISMLQKMIKTWLDEVYPLMPESERIEKATNMDMTLIETTKEYSVKNILEINSIYRLSLIEMQFIKKEMMNALFAMDELMGSNEINIKLAAMTPAFLIASSIRYAFRKLYYALLKIGKSKEETFAQFRHIILDIERLLVMRDLPPSPPPPLSTGINILRPVSANSTTSDNTHPILSSDDLGMLMLLVHECRVILWQDRKRFSRSELRNASEDLAELAGERGAVSVQQQLQIIVRMGRTYSFLKVISSGLSFSVDP